MKKDKKEPYAVITLDFYGKAFSAEKVEESMGIKCSSRTVLDESGKIGRYKNKTVPYGFARFEAPKEIPEGRQTLWFLKALNGCIRRVRVLRVETIHLTVGLFYGDHQCNWELSSEEIELLHELKVNYLYSVY